MPGVPAEPVRHLPGLAAQLAMASILREAMPCPDTWALLMALSGVSSQQSIQAARQDSGHRADEQTGASWLDGHVLYCHGDQLD